MTYPHLDTTSPETPHLQRLPRVRVAQIAMAYLAHGWSADEMCRQYPHLTLPEVHSAMAYYFDHQETMDAQIRREFEQVAEEMRTVVPPAVVLRLTPRKAV